MKFNSYITEQESKANIAAMLFMMEDNLNEENLEEGLKDFMHKMGLHTSKSKGLIDYFIGFTKNAGKLIIAAMKDDKAEVKRIADLLTREEVLDFLLKLDTVTMHLVTGPIHMIDAVTGWHIGAAVKQATQKAGAVLSDIWKYIGELKIKISSTFDKTKTKILLRNLHKLEDSLPKETK